MRAIILTLLPVLLVACGPAGLAGLEPAPPAPVSGSLVSSGSSPAKAEPAAPYLELDSGKPGSQSETLASAGFSTEGSALVPLGMNVPLVAWNSVQHAYELQLIDPATGQVFPGRTPIEVGRSADYPPTVSLSPDGSRLAFVTGIGSACEAYQGCRRAADEVQVIDLLTWRSVTGNIAGQFPEAHSPLKGWVDPLVFSPDGGRLALAYHDRDATTAMLFDAQNGQLIGWQTILIRPRLMEFSADGTELVIYGSPLAERPGISQPDPPSVVLLDTGSLEIQWRQLLPDILDGSWCLENCERPSEVTRGAYWSPAVVFSPERQALYVVHADADRLTTVDFQDRSVRSETIGPRPTWIERLLAFTADVAEAKYWAEGASKSAVLSPGGSRLYAIGQAWDRAQNADGEWQVSATSLDLQVVEISSGYEMDRHEIQADWIGTSADHRFVLLQDFQSGWPGTTQVLEADGLDPVSQLEGWRLEASLRLDGEPVLMAIQYGPTLYRPTRVAMLTPETFEILPSWSATGISFWLTLP